MAPTKETRAPVKVVRPRPIPIAPGVTFVDASVVFMRGEQSVLEVVWELGFDTVFEMRPTVARA